MHRPTYIQRPRDADRLPYAVHRLDVDTDGSPMVPTCSGRSHASGSDRARFTSCGASSLTLASIVLQAAVASSDSSSQHFLNAFRCGLDGVSPIPHYYERRKDGERNEKDPRRKGEVYEERHGAQCTYPYGRDRGFHVFRLHAVRVPTLCRCRCSQMHTVAAALTSRHLLEQRVV